MENTSKKVIDALTAFVASSHNGNKAAAARALGLKNMTLTNWLEGKRTPNLDALQPVFDALGWQLVFPGEHVATYEFIPCGVPSLKDGILHIEKSAHPPVVFERNWMQFRGINVANAVMLEVADDTMAPDFTVGDLVLLDQADARIMPGRIYLLSDSQGYLKFRRIKSESIGGWSLLCSNPTHAWQNESVPDITKITLHGRVRWVCRMYD